ncbi:eukaryotic translation initiation factor 3 subunit J-A-like [Cimex lectularius]|uniref:Uncharacterized protein n=1 Tax=Cimex lectularius TaxID=79782 RepID=A0A8I6TC73_CIMLE|nr:eukaryotic translation initiation factor 3 subunit J-A-like [Cimex lectularius]
MESWERSKNAWEGEDEEKSVKDSWDQDSDEEGEKEKEKKQPQQPSQGSKKSLKKICKRFEEKERLKEEEAKARRERLKAELAAAPANSTAEKLRRRRLQEAADLAIAKEVYGIPDQTPKPAAVRPSS